MKKGVLISLVYLAFIFSCNRAKLDTSKLVKATLLGVDSRACAVCGGYYLNLSDDTTANINTLRAIRYPTNLNTLTTPKFPVKVYISYQSAVHYHFPDSTRTIEILSIYNR